MASLIGPSRYMRSRKLKTNARTPINAAVAEWQERQRQGNPPKAKAEAVPPPEFGPPVDPERDSARNIKKLKMIRISMSARGTRPKHARPDYRLPVGGSRGLTLDAP
jgi:hypothetical protein